MTDTASRITAESFLTRLAERGIDYVMANAGTDFAPIIEALSRNPGTNRKYPRVITVPHENVAVAMAHGYYRVAGKPAAVMREAVSVTGVSLGWRSCGRRRLTHLSHPRTAPAMEP